MNAVERTVFQTYEAFFGRAYFTTATEAGRANNAAAILRLNVLIRMFLVLIVRSAEKADWGIRGGDDDPGCPAEPCECKC